MQKQLICVLLMVLLTLTKQVQQKAGAQVIEGLQACTACKTGPPHTALAAAACLGSSSLGGLQGVAPHSHRRGTSLGEHTPACKEQGCTPGGREGLRMQKEGGGGMMHRQALFGGKEF